MMRAAIAKRLSSFDIDVPALRPGSVGAYAALGLPRRCGWLSIHMSWASSS
jgi:hypothetical protein